MLTRLPPSPTGALHVGNGRTFLINWLLARQNGWRIVMRIEDLDGPRIKQWSIDQLQDDLRWLGLDWDDGPVLQSTRRDDHAAAVQKLIESGDAYPCICTRKDVERAASAPHAEDGSSMYPGSCRGRFASIADAIKATGRPPVIRFRVPADSIIQWTDGFAGPQQYNVPQQLGDFVIAKADGSAAYQLAVVVDDAAIGVTHIVRGDDLLDSTPRQILVYQALGLADKIPAYTHLPLLVGPDGRRLAKRHGDTRISYYRDCGITSRAMVAALARISGLTDVLESSPIELVDRFMLSQLPHEPVLWPGEITTHS